MHGTGARTPAILREWPASYPCMSLPGNRKKSFSGEPPLAAHGATLPSHALGECHGTAREGPKGRERRVSGAPPCPVYRFTGTAVLYPALSARAHDGVTVGLHGPARSSSGFHKLARCRWTPAFLGFAFLSTLTAGVEISPHHFHDRGSAPIRDHDIRCPVFTGRLWLFHKVTFRFPRCCEPPDVT